MKPKSILSLALGLGGLVAGCSAGSSPDRSGAAPSSGTVAWTIKNLGSLGGNFDMARGLNASGQVVGEASTATGGMHAFLYSDDKMQDLGTLPGYPSSAASAINAAGQIVGWVATAQAQRRAFIYSGGRKREIGTLGGNWSAAYAINDAGEIAGEADTSTGQRHAFLFAAGRMHDLGILGGAYGLNDAGQVVGVSDVTVGGRVPFLYHSDKMTALDTSGYQTSRASAINSAGQIVGTMGNITQWSSDHAFLYSDGKLQDLGNLGGNVPFSEAEAISAGGQIVGVSGSHPLDNQSLDGERAFLYSGGQMQDLRHLVGEANLAAAGFKALNAANGINDRGQIAGNGTDVKTNRIAFLLTPTGQK